VLKLSIDTREEKSKILFNSSKFYGGKEENSEEEK
jgi:hypothetical protein